MKQLYIKLLELLSEIPEIRWIDMNTGQMQEENPPVAFPCVLIDINANSISEVDYTLQIVEVNFTLQVNFKALSESNSKAPKEVRESALEFYDLIDSIHKKLQAYSDSEFEQFNRISVRNNLFKKGVKTVVLDYQTAYYEDISNS